MSLIASGVSTVCRTQLVPPSSVRARKPPSPPTQPRLLSRKKTVFKSLPARPARVAVQPCCAAAERARTIRNSAAVNNRVFDLCTNVSPGPDVNFANSRQLDLLLRNLFCGRLWLRIFTLTAEATQAVHCILTQSELLVCGRSCSLRLEFV